MIHVPAQYVAECGPMTNNRAWPFQTPEVALQEAFDIAMDYLEFVSGEEPTAETRSDSALVIVNEWQKGNRHRIWMANKAIVAAEEKAQRLAAQKTVAEPAA